MIISAASCQKAARFCYALQRTRMPLRDVRENDTHNITNPYSDFYGK